MAHDLIFPYNEILVANLNIMSYTASKFAIPADSYVHSTTGETIEQWNARYNMIITTLLNIPALDIICLEEVDIQFYNLLTIQFTHFKIDYDTKNRLVVMIKSNIFVELTKLPFEEYRFSKIAAYEIILTNGKYLVLSHVHLNGDPAKGIERREIINKLCEEFPSNQIIIGDFNENLSQSDIENSNYTILERPFKTSYSRFKINPAGFVTGIHENQWDTVDNIIFNSDNFKIINDVIVPERGLENRYVPYRPIGDDREYKYAENYSEWFSDHSLNIYQLYFIPE
jgi:hypothetical protein